MKKGIITNIENKRLAFIFEDGKLTDVDQIDESIISNIYLVRVCNRIDNIKSAFVDTSFGKAVLKLNKNDRMKNGALVLGQVVKEKHDNKLYTLTTNLSLKGEYVVVKYLETAFAVSNRIKTDISRYKKIYNEVKRENFFILFRTLSMDVGEDELIQDIKNVYQKFDNILKIAKTSSNLMKVYENENFFNADTDYITDDVEFFQKYKGKTDITLYTDDYPLSNVYGLKGELKKLFDKRVHLKNGSNIVIQKTEALTVVDVNSAKAIVDSKTTKNALDINVQAGIEVLRQIRCRNISGIVVIDFLNMRNSDNAILIRELKKEALKDTMKVRIYGFTQLGLLELTRQREKVSLNEYMNR